MASGRKMRAVLVEEYGEAETMKVNPDVPVPKLVAGKVSKCLGIYLSEKKYWFHQS